MLKDSTEYFFNASIINTQHYLIRFLYHLIKLIKLLNCFIAFHIIILFWNKFGTQPEQSQVLYWFSGWLWLQRQWHLSNNNIRPFSSFKWPAGQARADHKWAGRQNLGLPFTIYLYCHCAATPLMSRTRGGRRFVFVYADCSLWSQWARERERDKERKSNHAHSVFHFPGSEFQNWSSLWIYNLS